MKWVTAEACKPMANYISEVYAKSKNVTTNVHETCCGQRSNIGAGQAYGTALHEASVPVQAFLPEIPQCPLLMTTA